MSCRLLAYVEVYQEEAEGFGKADKILHFPFGDNAIPVAAQRFANSVEIGQKLLFGAVTAMRVIGRVSINEAFDMREIFVQAVAHEVELAPVGFIQEAFGLGAEYLRVGSLVAC